MGVWIFDFVGVPAKDCKGPWGYCQVARRVSTCLRGFRTFQHELKLVHMSFEAPGMQGCADSRGSVYASSVNPYRTIGKP